MAEAPLIRWGLRGRLTLRVAALVLFITSGVGLLLITSETVSQHALLVKDGELLAQTLASMVARYPNEQTQLALKEIHRRAARRFDVESIAIIDDAGVVLASSDPLDVGKPFDPGRLSLYKTQQPGDRLRRLMEPVTLEVTAPVIEDWKPRGFVYLRFRSEEIVEKARSIVQAMLIAVGFFLVVGIFLSALYVDRITRPLVALAERASGLREGEVIDVRTPWRDEVWLLADRLNAMSRTLGERAKEKEKLLDDLVRLNSTILASIDEGIVTIDARGRIQAKNAAAERFLAPAVERAIEQASARGGAAPFEVEVPDPAAGGTRTLEVAIAHLKRGGDTRSGDERGVVTIRDRTRQKKLEMAMRLADKLNSLGTISGSLTHELGNYTNVIRGYCSVLLRDLPAERPERADVEAIKKVNEQAIRLIDRFAMFARPQPPRFDAYEVADVVERATSLLAPRLRAQRVDLARELEPGLPRIRGDVSLLVQAFFNVLLNGAQAMPQGGRVVIAARAVQERREVSIEFRDAGTGIPKDVLPRVFDPFFTTKPEGEGTGLGLPIVYRILELHGGRVSIDSEVGRGTTVRLEIPAAEPVPVEAA